MYAYKITSDNKLKIKGKNSLKDKGENLLMKIWGWVAWNDLIMFRWEKFMHQWEIVSWFMLREQENVEEDQTYY